MENKKVMLVDGMALLFRSFYATAMSGYYMVNSKGIPTNAIHGFVKHLFSATNRFEPTHVICCWDMGSETFRNDIYPAYKANRGEPPVELIPQFDLVKEVVEELSIPNVGLPHYEADDCIGTLAQKYAKEAEVMILTGDQDILQLIQENISVILLKKGIGHYQVYNPESFFAEKAIQPHQMVDLKAFMGDSSDNYPGVKGIGEKTALKLLQTYQSIEGVLANVEALTPAQRRKIQEEEEMLHLCRKLAQIHCQVEVDCSLEEALYQVDEERMRAKFAELELKNLEQLIK
ncbi:5'-3' exonuclease [Alkalihalobacillus oceani]|uniref:5'-3' exonuclease n=1 Tax=Halalkalibacter oceani TaxID=1653776 RepID=UPI002040496C|nr:5'-3' exonuclease [Halalkalibacter oceani]